MSLHQAHSDEAQTGVVQATRAALRPCTTRQDDAEPAERDLIVDPCSLEARRSDEALDEPRPACIWADIPRGDFNNPKVRPETG